MMASALEPESGPDKGRRAKPTSVWLAQGLLAFVAVLAIVRTFVAPGSVLLQAALCLVLIYVVQKRVAWARWALSAYLVFIAGRSQFRQWTSEDAALGREPMQIEVRPDERMGTAFGGMLFCAFVVLVAGRVAFGASSRAYFLSGTGGEGSGHSSGSSGSPTG